MMILNKKLGARFFIALLICNISACVQHEKPLPKQVEGKPLITVCIYNQDTIVQKTPHGFLIIDKYEKEMGDSFLVADNITLNLVAKNYHECNSYCIYYDSIVGVNNPKLEKLIGQHIATLYKNEDLFRDSVASKWIKSKVPTIKKAHGKIIYLKEDVKFYHHGLLFVEE